MPKKRLLILGPSFRRKKDETKLAALDRFDGLFFRVARKYLKNAKDVEVVIMQDDLTLTESFTPLNYVSPKGSQWRINTLPEKDIDSGRRQNEVFLKGRLARNKYKEVFIAMGKTYANALPELSRYGPKVIFPTGGGLGPKAVALKEWLLRK